MRVVIKPPTCVGLYDPTVFTVVSQRHHHICRHHTAWPGEASDVLGFTAAEVPSQKARQRFMLTRLSAQKARQRFMLTRFLGEKARQRFMLTRLSSQEARQRFMLTHFLAAHKHPERTKHFFLHAECERPCIGDGRNRDRP